MMFKDEAEHARYIEATNFLIELLDKKHVTILDILKSEHKDKIQQVKKFIDCYSLKKEYLSMYRKIIDSNLTGHKLNEFFYSIINCLKATKESHCDRWAMVLLDKETSNYIRFLIKNIDENVNLENFENYCYNLSSSNVKLSANSIILRINILKKIKVH